MSIYFYGCITMDGYLADKAHNLDWLYQTGTTDETDMVDYIILQIAPVLLGAGIPLFTQKEQLTRFRLKSVKKYGQFAELVYEKG